MFRLVLFLIGSIVAAAALSWLADRPGSLVLNWEGYDIETSVFRAVVLLAFLVGLAIFLWSIARQIWTSPAAVGQFFNRRRQERGLEALSSGMIAIGAGDRTLARQYAIQAQKALPNEPLTHLLRAQTAQLVGDRATSRRIFEAMLASPDTEQLGLRGLFLEAEREGEREAARQFAERALQLNPKLTWPFDALFHLQCKASNWASALETLAIGRKHGQLDKPDADRRRAVLLTAQAQAIEDENGQKALDLALEAHTLAPDLVPAAAIAGRQLASRGSTPKAARVIEKTWKRAPHPDLSVVYAFARPGDSPRDRLERIKRLARSTPHSSEGPIAVATAAVEARNWSEAREALTPLHHAGISARVCTLMARIEGGEKQNAGAVREWLARAVHAPRDPAWTADGVIADSWAPISPVTGALDAFQWKVPLEAAIGNETPQGLEQLAEFAGLGAPTEAVTAPVHPATIRSTGPGKPVGTQPTRVSPAKGIDDFEIETAPKTITRSPAANSEASISVEIVEAKPVRGVDVKPAIVQARPAAPVHAKPVVLPANGTTNTSKSDQPKAPPAQAKPYVPPPAPDDPGPDEPDDILKPRHDYVATPSKRTTY